MYESDSFGLNYRHLCEIEKVFAYCHKMQMWKSQCHESENTQGRFYQVGDLVHMKCGGPFVL